MALVREVTVGEEGIEMGLGEIGGERVFLRGLALCSWFVED